VRNLSGSKGDQFESLQF